MVGYIYNGWYRNLMNSLKILCKSDFFLYKFDVYNSGYLCVWMPLVCMALEDPPDPKKNIRELKRYFKLSDEGLTYFTVYKE